MDVQLDLRKSVSENARDFYEKAKKATEKIKGARKALDDTEEALKGIDSGEQPNRGVRRKDVIKLRWYEKFRWFESTKGFLVVGGRDAVTNEILIKKHVESNDLIFHADVQGAPFFVVKNPSSVQVDEDTLRETAQAAASYSSAWKRGVGSCDVYQVKPEQVSKTAESGEYIPKGGFMIRGHKNWFRDTSLRLAVGFEIAEGIRIIGGPVKSINAKTKHYAEIVPGNLKSKELAIEVKNEVLKKCGKDAGQLIKKASIEDIQKFIPGGEGRIA